jgi:hypothetical protein
VIGIQGESFRESPQGYSLAIMTSVALMMANT